MKRIEIVSTVGKDFTAKSTLTSPLLCTIYTNFTYCLLTFFALQSFCCDKMPDIDSQMQKYGRKRIAVLRQCVLGLYKWTEFFSTSSSRLSSCGWLRQYSKYVGYLIHQNHLFYDDWDRWSKSVPVETHIDVSTYWLLGSVMGDQLRFVGITGKAYIKKATNLQVPTEYL